MADADQPASTGRATARRWLCLALVAAILAGGAVLYVSLTREVATAPAVGGHNDFLAFHSAAQMITRGTPRDLYNASALTGLERQVIAARVGAAGYMPYISPPFAAAVQAPLGLLSEPAARVLWLLLSIPLALFCCWRATDGMRPVERGVSVLSLVATFPFYQSFVEGQWSFVCWPAACWRCARCATVTPTSPASAWRRSRSSRRC